MRKRGWIIWGAVLLRRSGEVHEPGSKHFPHDIGDPQSWNKYGYTRNNPLRYTDPDGEDWRDALAGALNAFGSDNLLGAGRASGGNSDFRTGQAVGDAVATVQGTVETLVGIGGEVGGTLLDFTGVGALVGFLPRSYLPGDFAGWQHSGYRWRQSCQRGAFKHAWTQRRCERRSRGWEAR